MFVLSQLSLMRAKVFLLSLIPLVGYSQKPFNDLKDFGFMDRTKSVTCAMYHYPVLKEKEWDSDSLPVYTRYYQFNSRGFLLCRKQVIGKDKYSKEYSYANFRVKEAIEKSSIASFDRKSIYYWTDTSNIEEEYDNNGNIKFSIQSFLDTNMLTCKEICKKYGNTKDSIVDSWTVMFTHRDNGLLDFWTSYNWITHERDTSFIKVFRRDTRGSPLLAVKWTDNKPYALYKYSYEYWADSTFGQFNQDIPSSEEVQDHPLNIIRVIINAAKSGDFSKLSVLASTHPKFESDYDVKNICGIAKDTKDHQNCFREMYSSAAVLDFPTIGPHQSQIRVSYGKFSEKSCVFNRVKVNNKRFLYFIQ